MAVRDGVVVWLGSDDVGRRQFPRAQHEDLADGFVAPGFVDSHVHVSDTGLLISGLDLRRAASRAQCLQMVADYAAAHPDRPVWGHGWDESAWPENAPPSTSDLDRVLGDRPAYLARVDVHSAVASTALRRLGPGLAEAAGFAAERPLAGDAHHLLRAVARRLLTDAQLTEARTAALRAAAAAGIVAVHECAGPAIGGLDDWRALRALADRALGVPGVPGALGVPGVPGVPGVEVIGYWGEAVTTAAQARALVEQTGARGLAGDLFVDGALGSHTAWLHEPYADAPECAGTCHLDAEALEAHVRACTEAQVPAGFHVIGDAAVSAAVDAFGRVAADLGEVAVARCGHRLEHLEMVTADQAAQLGAWGVIASVQPGFDALWGGTDGMYARRLGVQRASRLNPLALLASQGVPLALGSDTPVTEPNARGTPW
ncbi:MAG: amidohydrolase family protein, partial [Mycobacterium sp.]